MTTYRWILAAAVLGIAVLAAILVPRLASEPRDQVRVQPLEAAPPAAPIATPAPAPAPAASGLAWDLPPGWSEIPAKPMRLASFTAPGGAECGLFIFPTGGDRLANVNRWRGQVGLPPLAEAELASALTAGTCAFGPFHWLPVVGAERAFLAAIVPTPQGQAFVKLETAPAGLDGLREGFLAFTASLRPR